MEKPCPTHSRTVLVVDDEEAVRDSLSDLLSGFGYRVVLAENAGGALEQMDREQPDLVLTDIYMERGDGYELISALRERSKMIPVVAMSAGPAGDDTLNTAPHLRAHPGIHKAFPA